MVGSGADPNKRMPMVWSATDDATTKAPPGGTYDEGAVVPVDVQLKDPRSLLSFYRDVLALKKKHPAIARGTYRSIAARDRSVLAFSDTYQGATVYVLENLDDTAHVEALADLGVGAGARLADHLLTDGRSVPVLSGGRLTLPAGSVAILTRG